VNCEEFRNRFNHRIERARELLKAQDGRTLAERQKLTADQAAQLAWARGVMLGMWR
jgi:hypothetical protein